MTSKREFMEVLNEAVEALVVTLLLSLEIIGCDFLLGLKELGAKLS